MNAVNDVCLSGGTQCVPASEERVGATNDALENVSYFKDYNRQGEGLEGAGGHHNSLGEHDGGEDLEGFEETRDQREGLEGAGDQRESIGELGEDL